MDVDIQIKLTLIIIMMIITCKSIPVDNSLSKCTVGKFYIDCDGLGLEDVPHLSDMNNSNDITHIVLMKNKLTTLDKGIFDSFIYLEKLLLNNNKLTTLAAGLLEKLVRLTLLDLQFNKLNSLPNGIFDNQLNLDRLMLYNNQIESVSAGMFDALARVTIFSLKANKLQSLPRGIFNSLTEVTQLGLSKNQFTDIDESVFTTMENVVQLSLYENKLSYITVNVFASLRKLKTLWLNVNPLLGLDPKIFDPLVSLQKLFLPFFCNCPDNKAYLLPLIQNPPFQVYVIHNDENVVSEWIELNIKCNSTWIDIPYCQRLQKSTAGYTNRVTTEYSSTTEYLSTKEYSSTKEYRSTKEYFSTEYWGTNKAQSDLPGAAPNEEDETTEGIIYTTIAAAVAILFTVALVYNIISRPSKMLTNELRTRSEDNRIESIIEDVMFSLDESDEEKDSDYCNNIPPVSYENIVYLNSDDRKIPTFVRNYSF